MPPFPLRFHFEKRHDRYYSHSLQFLLQLAATSFQNICFLITIQFPDVFPIRSPYFPLVHRIYPTFPIFSIYVPYFAMFYPWIYHGKIPAQWCGASSKDFSGCIANNLDFSESTFRGCRFYKAETWRICFIDPLVLANSLLLKIAIDTVDLLI